MDQIHYSNPNFFSLVIQIQKKLPPLKNRYYFTTPPNIFDKVEFRIGSYSVVDSDGPLWEGILNMNKGKPGEPVSNY